MSDTPEQKDSTVPVVLIVLGIVGGILVLFAGLIVVCLVAITMLGRNASATFSTVSTQVATTAPPAPFENTPEGGARQFCSHIDLGELGEAYDRLTNNRRQLLSRQAFQAEIDRRGPLQRPRDFTLRPSARRDDPNAFDATFAGYDDARVDVTLVMTSEDGTWKVDEFHIGN